MSTLTLMLHLTRIKILWSQLYHPHSHQKFWKHASKILRHHQQGRCYRTFSDFISQSRITSNNNTRTIILSLIFYKIIFTEFQSPAIYFYFFKLINKIFLINISEPKYVHNTVLKCKQKRIITNDNQPFDWRFPWIPNK